MDNDEKCSGCGHFIGQHIQSVNSRVYCWHIETGMSTGIIAPYYLRCDCVDYKSQRKEVKDKEEANEKLMHDEYMDAILSSFKWKAAVRSGLD